ncbi:MAG: hypothetical protein ACLU99_02645 [Alphaproteobacteria bacterium]
MKVHLFFQGTVNAVINLVNKDFDSLFKNYSSEEVVLDLFDEIEAFVDYAASQKHLLGVILGQKALKVLGSSEFIRADIDRQFTEEDDDDELFYGLPLDCAICDGIHCYRHCADVSYLNAGGYGSFWECPEGPSERLLCRCLKANCKWTPLRNICSDKIRKPLICLSYQRFFVL